MRSVARSRRPSTHDGVSTRPKTLVAHKSDMMENPFELPEDYRQSESVQVLRCQRETKSHFHRTASYKAVSGDTVYSATFRSGHTTDIAIRTKGRPGTSPSKDYFLLCDRKSMSFSLRCNGKHGTEEMTVMFSKMEDAELRNISVHFFQNEHSVEYKSVKPTKTVIGRWKLDLGGPVVASKRNARLETDDGAKILVRKIESRTLEIESLAHVKELHLFVLSIAAFSCKL